MTQSYKKSKNSERKEKMTNPDSPKFDASSSTDIGTINVTERVLDHQTRLAVLEERSKNFATKTDLKDFELQITTTLSNSMQKISDSLTTQTRWLAGTCIACVAIIVTLVVSIR